MDWTTTKPTQSGYYWWRKNKYKAESIYYVFTDHDQSIEKERQSNPNVSRYESITNIKPENRVFYARWCHEGLYDKRKLDEIDGEWLGPLIAIVPS